MTAHDRRMVPKEARLRMDQLPRMVIVERQRRGLTQRAASAEMHLTASTITRIEHGQWPDVAGLLAICTWLKLPPGWLIGDDRDAPMDAYRRGWEDCAAAVRAATEVPQQAAGGVDG